jgi:glycosyltransferase involved in cell wall biosynthesis
VQQLPGAQLTIVGTGPEETMLRQFVKQAGLTEAVRFSGPASPADVAAAMATHEVLVVPSLQEPFGTVVPEALAMGCRVVTTTAGGLPEAGGTFTRKVPPNDVATLATAMVQALHDAPPSETALHPFLQQLTVDASAALFLTHIQQALAKLTQP